MGKLLPCFVILSGITTLAFSASNSYNVPAHASLSTGTYIEEIEPLSFGTIALASNTNQGEKILSISGLNGSITNYLNAQYSGVHRGQFRIYAPSGTNIVGIYPVNTVVETLSADGLHWFNVQLNSFSSANSSSSLIVPSDGYIDILYGGDLVPGENLGLNGGNWAKTWEFVPKNQTHQATFNVQIDY